MIVLNKSFRLKCVGEITLMPGTNSVPDELWSELLKQHPALTRWQQPTLAFPEGEIVVQEGTSIADLSEAKAARMVLECANPELRARWRASESRPLVVQAFEQVDAELAQRAKANAEKTAKRRQREAAGG